MRYIFILIIPVLLFSAIPARAQLAEGPDHTILWNEFSAVSVIDSFAVGIAPGAIVVCRYDDTLRTFAPANLLLVEFDPVSVKIYDTLLMLKTSADRIVFYNLSDLPQLTRLGTIDPGITFADFALHGQDLYVSAWFDGLWRFALDGFLSAQFVDSSRTGVLMTQLKVDGDTLYALDKYNGIMRYDVSGEGFGTFLDYLWIPFEVTSFLKVESLVVAATAGSGVIIGEFGASGSSIIDTIVGIDNPLKIFVTDSEFVFLGYRFMEIVRRNSLSQRVAVPVSDILVDGDVFTFDNQSFLLLPRAHGGLTRYDLRDLSHPTSGLRRSGPITDLLLHEGKLFTGGTTNPIDVFSFDTSASPDFDYTIYGGLNEVAAIDRNGDSLIVLYSKLNRVAFISESSNPDSFYIEGSIFVGDTSLSDILYISSKIDSVHPMLAVGETDIRVFALTDSSGTYRAATWKFPSRIVSVLVDNTLLFVSTRKNQLWIYRIIESLETELLSVTGFAGRPGEMMVLNGRLVVFVWDEMVIMDYSNPAHPCVDTVIPLPLPVLDAVRRGDKLYTVGPFGVGIYHLEGTTSELIEYGGRGGSMLDVEGNVLATSNGGAINIYRLTEDTRPTPEPEPLPSSFVLSQNYPNPFNTGTSIGYSLPAPSFIDIIVYNLLGQQVITLVNEEKPAGIYTAYWDGTDFSGSQVASGVYFYRLKSDKFSDSKKMILLK